MKIKLVIYSEDLNYVEHLINYLNIHYNDTLELNIFVTVQDPTLGPDDFLYKTEKFKNLFCNLFHDFCG